MVSSEVVQWLFATQTRKVDMRTDVEMACDA